MRAKRRAWSIAKPETQRIEVVGRSPFEPRVNGVSELRHATNDRAIGRATQTHGRQSGALLQSQRCRDRDLIDASLSGGREALDQLLLWRQRDDDAQKRLFIRAENEMTWSSGNNLGVPIPQHRRWGNILVGGADPPS